MSKLCNLFSQLLTYPIQQNAKVRFICVSWTLLLLIFVMIFVHIRQLNAFIQALLSFLLISVAIYNVVNAIKMPAYNRNLDK